MPEQLAEESKGPKGYQSLVFPMINKPVSCFLSVADEAHQRCDVSGVELAGAKNSGVCKVL